MSINSILSIGLQGVQAGNNRIGMAGGQMIPAGRDIDNVALARSMVELKSGELQIKSSANVIKTADQMLGTLIDLRA